MLYVESFCCTDSLEPEIQAEEPKTEQTQTEEG